MKVAPSTAPEKPDYPDLDKAQLRQLLLEKEARFADTLKQRDQYIQILEEMLRLAKIQRFAARSEKNILQGDLFDEAELESALEEIADELPDDAPGKPRINKRKRGFSPSLERKRVELTLSEEEKAGAIRTFFTKVKEELDYIPAQLVVLEYWQEKAVFAPGKDNGSNTGTDEGNNRTDTRTDTDDSTTTDSHTDSQSTIIAAPRPLHPLGKCQVSTRLLAQIMIGKYADGLPLYRQQGIFKRYGEELDRGNMAHWMIRLGDDVFKPLMTLMREHQNQSDYLQADETRIQVLKETGKTAQSDKWMWVVRGGPPGQVVTLFEYDPSRSGEVPERLLPDFRGILQVDGYSGYARLCQKNGITRIGCWDHARRKFVEAVKAAGNKRASGKVTKADVAVGMIGKLYRIERQIKDLDTAEKYRHRQQLSVPALNELKAWLEKNTSRVMKGSLTRKAMEYCLNQWESLIGYCQRGDLHISNVLAENAIRPFAVGRKAWLFADTPQGARASATCYSLVETAKANELDPYTYIHYLLEHVATADSLEKWEALLPWNVPLAKIQVKGK